MTIHAFNTITQTDRFQTMHISRRQMDPPFKTARAKSELFAVQCHQWEPIWNGQLIRKYRNHHNSFTLFTALHAIQLYMLSFGVELLDRSVIHLLLQNISVNLQLLLCFNCILLLLLLLLLLCITQQQQAQLQQQQEKINIKVFGK